MEEGRVQKKTQENCYCCSYQGTQILFKEICACKRRQPKQGPANHSFGAKSGPRPVLLRPTKEEWGLPFI